MAKLNQLTRYSRIINKLSGLRQYVPAGELIDAMGGLTDFGINYTRGLLEKGYPDMEESNERDGHQDAAQTEEINKLPSPNEDENALAEDDTEHNSLISNISKIWKRISN